ncbi:MAG: serine/threonine protein kinase [Xanthomonadales bacterium]|nr:serine/threonine protein kinase [Xanthomonadales bacterium]
MALQHPIEIPGYELLQEIGSGGMANVYLAIQKSLDRKVAIKVLRTSQHEADPERTEKRFLREGRTLAKISHKNVCGIYDIAKVGNLAYIAMEYLEGGTLVDQLRGGMAAGEAIAVVVQVGAALAEAHSQGIVHRDLKPANVMMRGGRVPVLTDFGIARELTADQTKITAENMIVGTPIYMSPEQVSGGDVDGRSDLYSLGIMFFELLTGAPPYQGDTPIAVCMQHLTAPIPKLPPKLADLDPIIERMLAKKAEDRFDDMQSFTRELRQVFLQSEALRGVIASNPDIAWSEQLRELGFSFDTLRDTDLRAAMARKSATPATQPMPRQVPKAVTPAASAQARRSGMPRWLLPALGGVALLLAVIGLWQIFGGEKLTDEQLAALTTMVQQFDRQIGEGRLVQPAQDSALQSLRGMYAISRSHNLVSSRENEFQKAVEQRLKSLLDSQQFGEGRALLMDAQGALPEDVYEQQLASLDQAQAAAQREAAIAAQVAKVGALLDTGDQASSDELARELAALLEISGAADQRYAQLLDRTGALLSKPLVAAIEARDLDRARQVQSRIEMALPGSRYAQSAQQQVNQLQAQLALAQTLQSVEQLLRRSSLGADGINEAIVALESIEQANAGDSRIRRLEDQLIERAATEATRARGSGDLMLARALIEPLLARRADASSLRGIADQIDRDEQALAAQRRAEEEARRAGRLALDASPWAELVSLTGSDGQRVDLPRERSTPLLLTLPEGRYTVAMRSPAGETREVAAEVKRGELAVAELKFAQVDVDRLLREAGYR